MSTPQKPPPPTNFMAPSRANRHWLLNYADELDARANSLEGHEARKNDCTQYKARATKARNLLANYEKMHRALIALESKLGEPTIPNPGELMTITRGGMPTKTRRDSC